MRKQFLTFQILFCCANQCQQQTPNFPAWCRRSPSSISTRHFLSVKSLSNSCCRETTQTRTTRPNQKEIHRFRDAFNEPTQNVNFAEQSVRLLAVSLFPSWLPERHTKLMDCRYFGVVETFLLLGVPRIGVGARVDVCCAFFSNQLFVPFFCTQPPPPRTEYSQPRLAAPHLLEEHTSGVRDGRVTWVHTFR